MRFILVIFLLSYAFLCAAQSLDQGIVTIRTNDKQTFIGQLVNISSDSITIENKSLGTITLARTNIFVFHKGVLGLNQKNSSQPYYIPTAIPNGKNNHYYRNYALFGQDFSFGLTDNLDVSLGFEILSVFVSDAPSWPIIQFGGKYSGALSQNTHIGFATKVLFNDYGGVILASVPFTFGGLRSNFTFAPTFSQQLGEDNRDLVASFNINISLSDRVRLSTDCLYADGSIIATTLLEIRPKTNALLQPGIIYSNDFGIIPNFAFTIPFGAPTGKKK